MTVGVLKAAEVKRRYRDTAFELSDAAKAFTTQAVCAKEYGFHPAKIYALVIEKSVCNTWSADQIEALRDEVRERLSIIIGERTAKWMPAPSTRKQ